MTRESMIPALVSLMRWPGVLAFVILCVASGAPLPAAAEASREGGEPAAAEAATAPEGEWQVDESGQQYRIEKVPKVAGAYQWLDEKTVLMPLGTKFEVVKHDDDWFWVKYLKPARELPKAVKKDPKPAAEELEKVAASYHFELPETDRLRFEDFGHGLPRQGQWRNGFEVVDINGDGQLDIVFGPARKGVMTPNIFLGDGRGNWQPWSAARFPDEPYDYGDVEAADFNGDGKLDLAFGIHLRGMLVLVGDGEGSFAPWSEGIGLEHPGAGGDISAFSSQAIESVDWNGDGKLDLLALGEGPKGQGPPKDRLKSMDDSSRGFLVYLNRGDGSWQSWRPVQGTNLRLNFGNAFVLTDLNRDGHPDLVSESRQVGSKQVLRVGVGGGRFDIAAIDEVRPRGLVTAVAAADLDGDENQDLVLGYMSHEYGTWRTGIDVLYGASDLTWKRRALFSEESRRGVSALASGDLDGDGKPDLAALTGRGETWILLADGDGWFAHESESLTPAELGCQGFGLRLVDLDGDGRDEVVASFAGEVTGMPGIPGLSHPGCAGEGSLRAWKPVPLP